MSWNTRDKHQKRLDQVSNNLEISIGYLREIIETYEEKHPAIAHSAGIMAAMHIELQHHVKILKENF